MAPSTAFRWCHRFLRVDQQAKSTQLSGIAEADETFSLRSAKCQRVSGRAPRRRGGHDSTRGTRGDHVPVLVAVATEMGIEHHALNMTTGLRVRGAWHIQNGNAYHSRLKGWIGCFHGVATRYLHHYLCWFRAIDRCSPGHLPPSHLLNLSLGRFACP